MCIKCIGDTIQLSQAYNSFHLMWSCAKVGFAKTHPKVDFHEKWQNVRMNNIHNARSILLCSFCIFCFHSIISNAPTHRKSKFRSFSIFVDCVCVLLLTKTFLGVIFNGSFTEFTIFIHIWTTQFFNTNCLLWCTRHCKTFRKHFHQPGFS